MIWQPRARRRAFGGLLVLLAASAGAQQWDVRAGTDGSLPVLKTVRISEGSPGNFTVHELTPTHPMSAATLCITRPRSATAEAEGSRQVVTVTPAMSGCPETRFILEQGGGWEEYKTGG
jgi:hypothetical protein